MYIKQNGVFDAFVCDMYSWIPTDAEYSESNENIIYDNDEVNLLFNAGKRDAEKIRQVHAAEKQYAEERRLEKLPSIKKINPKINSLVKETSKIENIVENIVNKDLDQEKDVELQQIGQIIDEIAEVENKTLNDTDPTKIIEKQFLGQLKEYLGDQ